MGWMAKGPSRRAALTGLVTVAAAATVGASGHATATPGPAVQRQVLDIGWLTNAERLIGARWRGASRIEQAGLPGAGRGRRLAADCAEALHRASSAGCKPCC